MKAPEKLYILHREDFSDVRILNAFTEKENSKDIEYTRTDYFIENVCEFLKINASKHTYFDEGNTEWYDTEELIEDFKNYMKGYMYGKI